MLPAAKLRLSLVPLSLAAFHAASGQLQVPSQYPTIQQAVAAAADGDEILVAPGSYQGNVIIEKAVTVRGRDGAGATTIVGSGSGPAVCMIAEDSGGTLSGFTVTNGAGQNGGGLFLAGNVSVTACTITGNQAVNGGGAFIVGAPVISEVAFHSNSAERGGGIFLAPDSSTHLDLCDFLGNSATDGGAVYVSPGAIETTLASVGAGTFENNSATDGGAIYARMSGLEVVGAVFTGNEANDRGGSVFAADLEPSFLTLAEFSGGEAEHGGAIHVSGGEELLLNTVAVHQIVSSESSAAVYSDNAQLSVKDSNLWGNSPNSLGGTWTDLGGNEFSEPQLCTIDYAPPLGVLDIQDILAFIDLFFAADPAADLAAPEGMHDLMDLLSFINSYYTGCSQ